MDISTIEILLIILICVIGILLVFFYYQMNKVRRHYRGLIQGVNEGNLEKILEQHTQKVQKLDIKISEIDRTFSHFTNEAKRHFQKIGFRRYNPFHETGGDQSFTLVLLNQIDNGVIISSFHQREVTRVYAKSVKKGQSAQKLSKEEEEILKEALNS